MRTLFYDDALGGRAIPRSIFLAGPTARGALRTPWRAEALQLLEERGFNGTLVIPEFRSGLFEELGPKRFAQPPSPIPAMRDSSHNILRWETTGIEQVTVTLFWMPFVIGEISDPASLPGFTTRAEVSRELARDPSRLVLGMPAGAQSSGHIRFHAHQAGVKIAATLEETIDAALGRL
jgi:hypothetical protein